MSENKQGLVITFGNQKGGVGKSVTTSSIAAVFGGWGLKVLVLDNDPQGNCSLHFGIDLETNVDAEDDITGEGTIAKLYLKEQTIEDLAVLTDVENVELIPSNIFLSEVEMSLPGMSLSDLRLSQALTQARRMYDVILIDNPPTLTKLSVNGMLSADYVIIPVGSPWALRSVSRFLKVLQLNEEAYKTNNYFLGVVITKLDNTKVMRSVRSSAQKRFSDRFFNTSIRKSSIALETEVMGQPITIYAPNSGIAEDYRALALEIANKVGLRLPDESATAAQHQLD